MDFDKLLKFKKIETLIKYKKKNIDDYLLKNKLIQNKNINIKENENISNQGDDNVQRTSKKNHASRRRKSFQRKSVKI